MPKQASPGRPWSWQGCYWDHEPQTEVELLRRGFCIAYITPDPGREWDALAKAGVPLLHVCGSLDSWLQDNSRQVEMAYKKAGGKMKLVIRKNEGHFLNGVATAAVVKDYMDTILLSAK